MRYACASSLVGVASLVSKILFLFIFLQICLLDHLLSTIIRTINTLHRTMLQLIVWYVHVTHITCICQCTKTKYNFGFSLVLVNVILLVLV